MMQTTDPSEDRNDEENLFHVKSLGYKGNFYLSESFEFFKSGELQKLTYIDSGH
jgi:hypothetical protein